MEKVVYLSQFSTGRHVGEHQTGHQTEREVACRDCGSGEGVGQAGQAYRGFQISRSRREEIWMIFGHQISDDDNDDNVEGDDSDGVDDDDDDGDYDSVLMMICHELFPATCGSHQADPSPGLSPNSEWPRKPPDFYQLLGNSWTARRCLTPPLRCTWRRRALASGAGGPCRGGGLGLGLGARRRPRLREPGCAEDGGGLRGKSCTLDLKDKGNLSCQAGAKAISGERPGARGVLGSTARRSGAGAPARARLHRTKAGGRRAALPPGGRAPLSGSFVRGAVLALAGSSAGAPGLRERCRGAGRGGWRSSQSQCPQVQKGSQEPAVPGLTGLPAPAAACSGCSTGAHTSSATGGRRLPPPGPVRAP
nr:heavy metal-associated isoprenylated plant protein 32-like [Cavia porcellus]